MKLVAFVTLVLFAGFSPLAAQTKIAVVNSQQIIENMPESKTIQGQIQKLGEDAEADFSARLNSLQADFESYEAKKELLTPEKRKQTEAELTQKQQELQQLRQMKLQELQQKRIELLKPMEDKVIEAIKAVAQKSGFDLVLDKTSAANVVLYADDALDITFKVLDYLKTAKSPAKPKSTK